jgi:hypothetical protein
MVDCLRLDEARKRDYLDILDRNAVSLEAIHGRRPDWRELAKGFLPRMAAALGLPGGPAAFRAGTLTEREEAIAREREAARRADIAERLASARTAARRLAGAGAAAGAEAAHA